MVKKLKTSVPEKISFCSFLGTAAYSLLIVGGIGIVGCAFKDLLFTSKKK